LTFRVFRGPQKRIGTARFQRVQDGNPAGLVFRHVGRMPSIAAKMAALAFDF
jgi:hypothetical protein